MGCILVQPQWYDNSNVCQYQSGKDLLMRELQGQEEIIHNLKENRKEEMW